MNAGTAFSQDDNAQQNQHVVLVRTTTRTSDAPPQLIQQMRCAVKRIHVHARARGPLWTGACSVKGC